MVVVRGVGAVEVTRTVADDELGAQLIVSAGTGQGLGGCDVGGVRLENDYLITKGGARNLCTLPMDIKWATRR